MATRKTNIDIEYDEPQQEATLGAAEPNSPYESQDPADWVPPMTVRIYPISKPRTKLLAMIWSRLLKSCATPPVSWPMASIRWARRSASSAASPRCSASRTWAWAAVSRIARRHATAAVAHSRSTMGTASSALDASRSQ